MEPSRGEANAICLPSREKRGRLTEAGQSRREAGNSIASPFWVAPSGSEVTRSPVITPTTASEQRAKLRNKFGKESCTGRGMA